MVLNWKINSESRHEPTSFGWLELSGTDHPKQIGYGLNGKYGAKWER